jgi:hypothetical protein
MNPHTPTPWKLTPAGGISGDGEVIVLGKFNPKKHKGCEGMNDGFGHANGNAELIVTAVNSHQELVRELAATRQWLEQLHREFWHTGNRGEERKMLIAQMRRNNEVLAKAKGAK